MTITMDRKILDQERQLPAATVYPAGNRPNHFMRRLLLAAALVWSVGCRLDMHDQPKYEPLEASDFFSNGQASRPLIEGTIARGQLRLDDHLYTGKIGDELVTSFPFEITRDHLERGQERFDIYCSPCHGYSGYGDGMIVRRGFRRPESFHTERLRESPPGHFFDVITNGFGAMFSYASRIRPEDRWAIVAYVRALQLSQNARPEQLSSEEAEQLRRSSQ